jgi:hypothetical protein
MVWGCFRVNVTRLEAISGRMNSVSYTNLLDITSVKHIASVTLQFRCRRQRASHYTTRLYLFFKFISRKFHFLDLGDFDDFDKFVVVGLCCQVAYHSIELDELYLNMFSTSLHLYRVASSALGYAG